MTSRRTLKLGLLASSSFAAMLVGAGTPTALAGQCTINEVGVSMSAVTSAASIDCINVQNSTIPNSVTNATGGTLTPNMTGTAPTGTGITINNSTLGGAVVNNGTISAAAGGGILIFSNATVLGGIANNGMISARGTGINLFEDTVFAGGITNAGTISQTIIGTATESGSIR
jgi:hypothetical protein